MIRLLKERFRFNSPIHYLDVSIILPFYKKLDAFKQVLPQNAPYYQRNGIEVIIVLDEPSEEKELLNFIQTYPFINWKVIVNRQKHEWRNPSKVINVGIRNASMKYIMVMSPESEFYTDAIFQLREFLTYYPQNFTIGQVSFSTFGKEPAFNFMRPFGSIMVKKEFLEQIGGYDERLNKWGGDDDDIRARLEMIGVRKMFVKEAILIHRERDEEVFVRTQKKSIPIKEKFRLLHPSKVNPNGNSWGYDFDEICFDWHTDRFNLTMCTSYLKQFVEHSKITEDALRKKRTVLLLVPAHNESLLISEFIDHISRFCDGIIFLDDGSTDDTYELMKGEKVLLKVKKENFGFNDIDNRNILLSLSYFFNSEWILYMDVDEQFDERYCNLENITTQNKFDVCAFKFVHLWDGYKTYNADFPKAKDGIVITYRMFRSKGHLQINTNRTLHFPSVPYFNNTSSNIPILVLHLGNLTKEDRHRKYDFYQQEDKTKEVYDYEYLVREECTLKNVSDLELIK